jgi:heme-degrading monooxygenase HmoA
MAPADFVKTPEPPYYAVIFTQKMVPKQAQTDEGAGYDKMLTRMLELVRQQPGFLGVEGAMNGDGIFGITTIYFDSAANIANWKQNGEHLVAQKLGKERWYEGYTVRCWRLINYTV